MSFEPGLDHSTSTTLIDACRSGGPGPLTELHRFVRPVLERWMNRVRRAGTPDFDEFFNECWLRIQRGVTGGSYDRGTPFRAWVGTLARNVLMELGRARQRVAAVGSLEAGEAEVATPDPLETAFEEEWSREVRLRALELTETQTTDARVFRAFVLRDLEGADYPEIANRLGLTPTKPALDGLHKQVHRVRKAFEDNLRFLYYRMT